VRPGTLAAIVILLIAIILFGVFWFRDRDLPAPPLPLPTVEASPTAS
jgi:hypothetical protein